MASSGVARSRVYLKRMAHDVKNMMQEGVEFDVVDENSTDGCTIRAWVRGPDDSPYSGHKFEIRILLVNEWPFKSPSVAFVTKVLHPNVEWASGAICCNQLNEEYTSATRLATIVNVILPQLLAYPNPDDPFNTEAASEYVKNHQAYTHKVRNLVLEHAIPCS